MAACSIDVDQRTQNTGHRKCYWNVERRTSLWLYNVRVVEQDKKNLRLEWSV